jgi:hypothetical protein
LLTKNPWPLRLRQRNPVLLDLQVKPLPCQFEP